MELMESGYTLNEWKNSRKNTIEKHTATEQQKTTNQNSRKPVEQRNNTTWG